MITSALVRFRTFTLFTFLTTFNTRHFIGIIVKTFLAVSIIANQAISSLKHKKTRNTFKAIKNRWSLTLLTAVATIDTSLLIITVKCFIWTLFDASTLLSIKFESIVHTSRARNSNTIAETIRRTVSTKFLAIYNLFIGGYRTVLPATAVRDCL